MLSLAACATVRRAEERVIGADAAPSAGFATPHEMLTPPPHALAPFDRVWVSRASDWRKLPKLYVAPVDTTHVLDGSLWDALNVRHSKVPLDREEAARALRERVDAAFRADPSHRFEVLDRPDQIDEDTAILELALVELVPNKAILGAIGLAAWAAPLEIGVPVATATAFVAHGSIAMEARVRHARSGRVIAMFADRETGKMRIIDLRSLTWYGNASEVMYEWADSLIALANARRDDEVKHEPLFTWRPW